MNTRMVYGSPVFVGEAIGTAQEKKDYVLTKANNCRWDHTPTFANEHQYLPVSKTVSELTLSEPKPLMDISELTLPPQVDEIGNVTDNMNEIIKGAIMVGSVILLIKLLS